MEGFLRVVAIFGIVVLILLLFVFLVRSWLFSSGIIREFKRCNVIVDGKKGTGKDLLFQYVIYKRNEHYYANIPYGYKYTHIEPKECSIAPNTYKDFIEGEVKKITSRFYEEEDFYFSEGGILFPNYVDNMLNVAYPYLPVTYALSRHISNANIHTNVQNFNRVWKKLREQADFYVHCCGIIKLPFHIVIKCVTYDKEVAAMQHLSPVRFRLFNKFDKAEKDIYKATNGEIKSGWVIVPKRIIKYETRGFEKVIYGDTPRRYRDKEERLDNYKPLSWLFPSR